MAATKDPERVAAVHATGVLDSPEPPGLRRLTRLASRLVGSPTALVSLVLDDRQVFASQIGLPEPWAERGQTPLSHSFCRHVVDDDRPLVVSDARLNDRLKDNLAIPEIGVIAYAGMPIRVDGRTLGSFCAIDGQPREWSPDDLAVLEDLAAAVSTEIALLRAARHAEETSAVVRRILEVSQDAYISIDAAGVVLEWNPAAEILFGRSRAEAVGADLAGLIIPAEFRDAHHSGLARVRATGQSTLAGKRIELPAVGRDGRRFPVEFTVQSTRHDGRVVFHAFLHDISERSAAASQLRRQAELIDAAPAAIIVRTPTGKINFWNNGAEQMYGWPAAAAVGRNIHRLLATVFPDDEAVIERALHEEGRWEGQVTHRRADGRTLTALSRHVVRPDAGGAGPEVIETNTDITERRRAEERLEASERQFRTQFHQSTVGQAIVGLDGVIRHVNEAYARMLGHSPEELIGRRNEDFTHPDDRAEGVLMTARLFAEEQESYERTKRLIHADGHSVDVHIGVRLVRDADGAPLHLIGVIQDITARLRAQRERDAAQAVLAERNAQLERANSELQRANLLKLDLMGMLSHDIGTPLTAILGYGEMLVESELPQPLAKPTEKIMNAAHRIDELRLNVLSMCMLSETRLHADRHPVRLAEALQDALDAADQVVPLHCPSHATVLVNPAHLRQIVVNFLTNARKYGGGATGIEVTPEAGTTRIVVLDRGPGVPAELREHLFERYTRAGGTQTSGHGLGLHIVASLAEANGGSVDYQPGDPVGSVFSLTLESAF
ncbi:putative multi-sensor signal transduction histidine kinase [Actinoplanes missouriensis 431]|uniref:histidine kinase n=1 Tax=Actinoplanes missouriensis (strain ATCC 14538 / DSM 43046 / CBS 188.64 / JCM 3121 / NBRC 102363 / NCIMB 12654 / NRRL B-3342 / UNCC 431) TaxID=512565 RepID=I0H1V0_ACTM4|nr:PAS domain S-box protein [Actinoplanes missouriensis]BAL86987.1 putative multi-sensor signal transduction histidine kinase [Actinoplanes missouriensis 431]